MELLAAIAATTLLLVLAMGVFKPKVDPILTSGQELELEERLNAAEARRAKKDVDQTSTVIAETTGQS